jgi:hypothetical protein
MSKRKFSENFIKNEPVPNILHLLYDNDKNSADDIIRHLSKHNTWISITVLNRAIQLGPTYLKAIIEKAYRFNDDAFLHLLSKFDNNIITVKDLKEIVSRRCLLPSPRVDDTHIDNIDFLKNVRSFVYLYLNKGPERGLDMGYKQGLNNFWKIIMKQYLYRISMPLFQVGFPPYVVLEIIDKIPLIGDEDYSLKIESIIGIHKSIKKIIAKRINL